MKIAPPRNEELVAPLITSDVMLIYQKWQPPALVSMILNFWCSLAEAAAEVHLCFVIKGDVWWKGTFLAIVNVVVLL